MVTVSLLSVTAVTSSLFGVLLYKLLRNRLYKREREPSVYVRPPRRTNTWEDFIRSFLIGFQQGLELLRACKKCPLFSNQSTTSPPVATQTNVCTDEACSAEPIIKKEETMSEFLVGMINALSPNKKEATNESQTCSSSTEKQETNLSDLLIGAFSAYAPSLSSSKDLEELIALYKQVQSAEKETVVDTKDTLLNTPTTKQKLPSKTPRRNVDVDVEPSTD